MSRITKFAFAGLWLLVATGVGAVLVITSAFLYLSPNLPSVDVLREIKLQIPLRIYSRDGELIGEFGEMRRTPVEFEQIPPLFIQAILAAEDDRFFSHHGVDITGLLRAASQLLTTGQIQTGGSTITMQVAKNYFLSLERTFSRKFNEIFLALQIERELSKEEILELYLNKIFLGNRAYGIEAAAQVYYGKSIAELNLAQWAMIAGLPKAPSSFNPIVNPSRAIIRRNWILGRMRELGHIGESEYKLAVEAPITASYHGTRLNASAPYVAEMARQELVSRFGNAAYTDGYIVHTTVDSRLQQAAQRALIDGLLAYDKRHGYRGPEARFPVLDESEDPTARWQTGLDQFGRIGELVPAIVTSIDDGGFTALLNDGLSVRVDFDSGISGWRPYVSVNRLGPAPARAADLVATGDLVRLQQSGDGSWALSQIPTAQAALVSLDADDGAILSLVGGFNFQQSKFNRVTQARRQPGSNFKPFIYSAALEDGFTPATIINDAPIVFDDAGLEDVWRPTNSSGRFYGPTRLRQALFLSRNLVSIRLLRSLGVSKAIAYSERFGFAPDQLPRDLSLALGSHSLEPMAIANGYAVFANGGYRVDAYLIDRITDITGAPVYQATPATVCRGCDQPAADGELDEIGSIEELLAAEPVPALPRAERVIDARVAYLMDSMLRDVVRKGTARRARSLERSDLAGKTGTTNGPTDAWFSGYGGGVVTTTWLGFDNNSELGRNEYGGSAALPIWIDFMAVALRDRAEFNQPQPEGLVTVKIDPESGKLARPGQSNAIFEIFRSEQVPTETAGADSRDGNPFDDSQPTPTEELF